MHTFLCVFNWIRRRTIRNDCLKRNSLRRLVRHARILQNYFIFRHVKYAMSTKNFQTPNCVTLLIYCESCVHSDSFSVFHCVVNPYKTSFVIHLLSIFLFVEQYRHYGQTLQRCVTKRFVKHENPLIQSENCNLKQYNNQLKIV